MAEKKSIWNKLKGLWKHEKAGYDDIKGVYADAKNGTVIIVSTPPNATVLVNDEKVGETTLTVKLDPGPYLLVLSKEGYMDVRDEIEVTAGKTIKVDFFLSKKRQVTEILNHISQEKKIETTSNVSAEPSAPKSKAASDIEKDMILIPGGNFTMGYNEGEDDEKPQHTVYLDAYYIDKHLVTNVQFRNFIDATNYKPERNWEEYFNSNDKGDYPVVNVSWNDANAFALWAGKRLPTEAEWEKAARGGTETPYYWGDTVDEKYVNCNIHSLHSVGKFSPNPLGLFDMLGNVWEWCSDYYDSRYYKDKLGIDSNPKGPATGEYYVVRGGVYYVNYYIVRVSYRTFVQENIQDYIVTGFRCAMDAK
jgi:formylglycine-generating enzyme